MNAASGKDIVCAAISAMTMLVVNTICEAYSQKAATAVCEESTMVRFLLKDKHIQSVGLIKSFHNELAALEKDYPENLMIIVRNILERE